MGAEWAFHTFDALTGARTGNGIVDLESWSHETRLNEAGGFDCRLAPPQSTTAARTMLAQVAEVTSVIVPFRNGAPVDGFAGWVPPGGLRRPSVAGPGLLGYFDRRHDLSDIGFGNVDQHSILAGYFDHVSAEGIQLDTSPALASSSAVLRNRGFDKWEAKNVGEAARQLSAVAYGPDFAILAELVSGAVVRRLRAWTPRRGRAWQDGVSPVFTLGGNLRAIPGVAGNEAYANAVIVKGEEINSTTHERRFYAVTSPVAGYPRVEVVLDYDTVREDDTMEEHGQGYLQRETLAGDDEMTLVVDPDDRTWEWEDGDDCMVVIPVGLDPWFPDGYHTPRRIVGHRWTHSVAGDGLELYTEPQREFAPPPVVEL